MLLYINFRPPNTPDSSLGIQSHFMPPPPLNGMCGSATEMCVILGVVYRWVAVEHQTMSPSCCSYCLFFLFFFVVFLNHHSVVYAQRCLPERNKPTFNLKRICSLFFTLSISVFFKNDLKKTNCSSP